MLNKIFKIKDSIDIYVVDTETPDKVLLTFHRMTTRERTEIITSRTVAEFLALLDGQTDTKTLLNKIGIFDENQATQLIHYLMQERFIIDIQTEQEMDNRYKRQIAFFDDMLPKRSGEDTQSIISKKKIVILGCGAVGSHIAETLVRAGVLNLTLVDYKPVSLNCLSRHLFTRLNDIGHSKVSVLKKYLESINHSINVRIFNEQLLPHTDLNNWIDDNTDLIINTCDEPYIGHTSLKVGRFAHSKKIPIYISGGFDAHLMSSGELINPPHTPCIDCTQKTFNIALKDWKPTYSNVINDISIVAQQHNRHDVQSNDKESYIVGGAGGLAFMSGFSSYLSCMTILRFLAEDEFYQYQTIRYEYLPNSGEMTEFEMNKQGNCNVCNR